MSKLFSEPLSNLFLRSLAAILFSLSITFLSDFAAAQESFVVKDSDSVPVDETEDISLLDSGPEIQRKIESASDISPTGDPQSLILNTGVLSDGTPAQLQNVVFPLDNLGKGVGSFDSYDLKSGAYAFSIPIEAPPGTAGLTPEVSISYSSEGVKDGLLGVGFSLSVEDCVERKSPPTQDGDGNFIHGRGAPSFTAADIFFHNGQPLLKCDSQPGGPSASCPAGTYRQQQNDFARIEKLSTGFKIYEKTGLVKEYGIMVNGGSTTGNFDQASRYCLNRTYSGPNEIVQTWRMDGRALPQAIYYGGTSPGSYRRSIVFEYEDRPIADLRVNYSTGSGQLGRTSNQKRLKAISVNVLLPTPGYSQLRKYFIDYESALSPDSGRSRVAKIRECGQASDAVCESVAEFSYAAFGTAGWAGTDWTQGGIGNLNASTAFSDFDWNRGYADIPQQLSVGSYVADIDGNGTVDLFRRDNIISPLALLNPGSAAWSISSALSPQIAALPELVHAEQSRRYDNGVRIFDINGDGYQDVVQAASRFWGANAAASKVMIWDPGMNGGQGGYNTSLGSQYAASLAAADIKFNLFTPNWGCTDYSSLDPGTSTADVNGDGLVDMVVSRTGFSAYGSQWESRNEIWLNTGKGFARGQPGYYDSFPIPLALNQECSLSGNNGVRIGDINGDGLPDVVQLLNDMYQLQTQGVVYRRAWINNGNGWNPPENLSGLPNNLNGLFSILKRGNYSTSPAYLSQNTGAQLADVNGDGLDDLVQALCADAPASLGGTDCSVWNTYLSSAAGAFKTISAAWKLPTPSVFITTGTTSLAPAQVDMGVRLTDTNDDGLVDVIANRIDGGVNWALNKTNQYRFDRDKIVAVKNRMGGSISIQYAKLGKTQNPKLSIPKVVVSSISTHNGRFGGEANAESRRTRTFSFYGGRLDKQSRGFAGFRAATILEDTGARQFATTTWFNNRAQDFCRLGTETETLISAGTCAPGSAGCYISGASQDFAPILTASTIQSSGLYSRTRSDYSACGADNGALFFPAPTSLESYNYDPQNPSLFMSKRDEFVYDNFGNLSITYRYKKAGDAEPYLADWAYFAVPASNSSWIYDRPAQKGQIAFAPDRQRAVKAEYFYYDNLGVFGRVGAAGLATRHERHAYDYELGMPSHRYYENLEYTAFGNLKKRVDARGFAHETDWNSFFPEIAPASESIKPSAAGPSQVTSYAYDPNLGFLTAKSMPNGTKEQYRYYSSNKLLSTWKESASGGRIEERQFFYNSLGQPASGQSIVARYIQGRADAAVRDETSYLDGLGRVFFKLNMSGDYLGVSTLYDGSGSVLKTTLPNSSVSFTLDRPLTSNSYDALGRKTNIVAPGGYQKNISYRLWQSDGGETLFLETESSDGQAGEWNKKHLGFDLERRLKVLGECESLPCDAPSAAQSGARLTRFGYDYVGNQTDVYLPGGGAARVKRFYDGFGRLEAVKDPDLSNCADSNIDAKNTGCPIRIEYDAADNISKFTDAEYALNSANGTRIDFVYDGLNRLTRRTLSRGGDSAIELYEFDAAKCGEGAAATGLLTAQSFSNIAKGESTNRTLCYDSFGRVNRRKIRVQIPGADSGDQEFAYAYYPDSKIERVTMPDGEVLTYGLDSLNRGRSLTSSVIGPVVDSVSYDSEGLKEHVYSGGGRYHTSYSYRNFNNLPILASDRKLSVIRTIDEISRSGLWEKTFDYDGLGNIKSIADWNFLTPDYEEFKYDHLNRLVSYDVDGSAIQRIWYDDHSNQSKIFTSPLPFAITPPALTAGLCADSAVRTKRALAKSRTKPNLSSSAAKKKLRRERASRRAALAKGSTIESSLCAAKAGTPVGLEVKRYNLSSSPSELSQKYGEAYSGFGGPHSVLCVGGEASDPCVGAAQLMEYDPNGNLKSIQSALAEIQSENYHYTFESRLSKITRGSLTTAQYFYGPSGEKTASRENGTTTFFIDKSYVIEGGQPLRFYEIDGQTLAYRRGNAPANYQVVDHLGSVRAVMDNVGNLVESREYYPFGQTLAAVGVSGTPEGFGGHIGYSSSVYDLGARFYHPGLQRFLQPDNIPLKMGDANNIGAGSYTDEASVREPDLNNGQSTNRYLFALNNPARFIDPDGHAPKDAVIIPAVRVAAPIDTTRDQRGNYSAYIGFSDNGGREITLNEVRGIPHYKVGMSDGTSRFLPVTDPSELQRIADDKAGVTDLRQARAEAFGDRGESLGVFVGYAAGFGLSSPLIVGAAGYTGPGAILAVPAAVGAVGVFSHESGKAVGAMGKDIGRSIAEKSVHSAWVPQHWKPEPLRMMPAH